MNHNTKSLKIISVASLGTIIEWAEYIFYGYMAITLSQVFFPQDNPTIDLFKTFGVFAAGYLTRPIGAFLFGYLGDNHGRKCALMVSMMMMGLATMGIGLLPGYEIIGVMAPLILLGLRLIQGLAVSGEYNGAAIFAIEHHPNKPCFNGSLVPASAAFGMFIGGGASFIVSLPVMPEWAWRVPFLLGGIGCIIALWLRSGLSDSREFTQAKHQAKPLPLWDIIKSYKLNFLRVGAIAATTSVYVYIGNVYFVVYLTQTLAYTMSQATLIALCSQLGVAAGIPVFGWLADKTSAEKLYKKGLLFSAVSFPFIFYLASFDSIEYLMVALALYITGNIWLSGPMMAMVQNEFPTLVRYRGTTLAWGVSAAIFGGSALMVAQTLQNYFESIYACGLYVSLFALLTWFIFRASSQKTIKHFTLKKTFASP